MKKQVLYFLVILITVVLCQDGCAQTKLWRKNKALRFYRMQIARKSDPVKVENNLKEAIGKTEKNYKIFFCLLLAEQYEGSGDFASAERSYMEAYTEAKRFSPSVLKSYLPNLSGTIYDSYDRLGYFYLRTGNLRKAEQLFRESEEVRNRLYPKRSVYRVLPLIGMGSLYFRRGEYDKTYAVFNRAIEMLNRATTTHFDYDNINRLFLYDLAELCMALGKNTEAFGYIGKLSVASSGVAKFNSSLVRKLEVARIFELKARYYLLESDFEKAQEYLRRANQYYPGKITVSDVKFKLLKTEALLYWYQNNTEKANEAFQKLVGSYREHIARNFVSMSEYEKEQFYNTLKNDFNLFNAYVLSIADRNPTVLYEEMYTNIINTKALLLNASNRQKNKILESGDAALIGRLHQWEQAKSLLAKQFYGRQTDRKTDSLERNIELLEKEINQRSDLFQQGKNKTDWKQIQSVLREGEAAIEIIRINTHDTKKRNGYARRSGLSDSTVYGVLVLKPGGAAPEFFYLPEGNQLEKKFLPFYRNSIYGQLEDKRSYDQFWLPIRRRIGNLQRIYLSPDGVFNQINLNTLQNPVSGKYLIDETELIYLTNTQDLLRNKSTPGANRKVVLVGRPAYKVTEKLKSGDESAGIQGYGLRNILTDELVNFREQEFDDLPGTESEITQIETTLYANKMEVTVFKGVQATEENVKAIRKPAILHVATHGFFIEDSASTVNPMIRSGVVLAGVQNTERIHAEDGILTAYEATNLDLESTDLVVLSACQTGLGEIRNGEGVYGLQRAIIVAGAKNLLMSLWKVDDEATSSLMVSLYHSWNGENNLKAFREAQLSLRSKYSHPFYWGAFIMLGN